MMSNPSQSERAWFGPRVHLTLFSLLAWFAGAVAAVATFNQWLIPPGLVNAPGIEAILAPTAFGAASAVVLLLGELALRRRLGHIRRASLIKRTVLGVADGWLLRLAALAFVLLVVIVLLGAALASPDGESFAHGTPGAYRLPTSDITVGIFPGLHYGVTLFLGACAIAVIGAGVLVLISNRPTLDDPHLDIYLRRLSAHRVLRACAASLLVTDAGAAFLAGVAVAEAVPDGLVHLSGLAVAATGLALGLLGVLVSMVPASRRHDPARAGRLVTHQAVAETQGEA